MSEFASRSHDELYAMIRDADPGTFRNAEQRWRTVADKLQNLAADLRSQAAGLQHSWSGQAADRFQSVAAYVAERTRVLGDKAAAVSTAMRTAGDALETAKRRMPEPPSEWERSLVTAGKVADKYGFVGGVAGFLGGKLAGEAAEAKQAEFEQKRREAVRTMEELDAAYASAGRSLESARSSDDPQPPTPGKPPVSTTGRGTSSTGDSGGVSAYRPGGGPGGGRYSGYAASGGGRVSPTPTAQGTGSGIVGGAPIGSDLSGVGTLPGADATVPGGGLPGTGTPPGGGLGGVLFPTPGGPLGGGGAWGGGRMPGRDGYGAGGFGSEAFGDGVDGGRFGGRSGGGIRGLAGGVGDDGIVGGRPGSRSRNGAGGAGNGMTDGPDGLDRGGRDSDEEERERGKRPSWLVEDAETWATKKPVVPPVIG